jgi:hypothetical protein
MSKWRFLARRVERLRSAAVPGRQAAIQAFQDRYPKKIGEHV